MSFIENDTKINFKTYRDYYFLNLRQNKLVLLFATFASIAFIMITIALIYNVFNFFLNSEPLSLKTFLPFFIISAIMILYYSFNYRNIIKGFRSNAKSFSQPIKYIFEENRMRVIVGKDRTTLRFSDLDGFFQNKKYFVLIFNNRHSLIIQKQGFKNIETDIFDLEERLKQALDIKFYDS